LLRTRILTGVVLAVVVAVSVLALPAPGAAVVFGVTWLIGADEWARLVGFGRRGRIAFDAGFALLVAAVIGLGLPAVLATAVVWMAIVTWLVIFGLVLRFPRPLSPVLLAPAGLVVLAAAWLSFYRIHEVPGGGPALILAGLIIVWSADIGAFFVGRNLGRTPLAPRVSPKKTWEGVAGGVGLATIVGCVAAPVLSVPLVVMAPLAAGMALVSVNGDLGVSMLKRNAGEKDAGMLLPGHGGILDRFDGVTAALPVFVLGLQFAHVLD
jgi:phosphatidate cytidylyltransferase